MLKIFKNKSSCFIRILIYIICLTVIILALIIKLKISSMDAFLGALGGGFIGFIGSLFLKDLSLYIEEEKKRQVIMENTKFVYEMYKMELEQNISHLKDMIDKKWMPFYRFKSLMRNNVWGQLTDYSRNLDLLKKINYIYQEFELINNKIDIMNVLYTQKSIARDNAEETKMEKMRSEQLLGSIELGEKVMPVAEECIRILDTKISQI